MIKLDQQSYEKVQRFIKASNEMTTIRTFQRDQLWQRAVVSAVQGWPASSAFSEVADRLSKSVVVLTPDPCAGQEVEINGRKYVLTPAK